MNALVKEKKQEDLKRHRFFKAFSQTEYRFFADWLDMEALQREALGDEPQHWIN